MFHEFTTDWSEWNLSVITEGTFTALLMDWGNMGHQPVWGKISRMEALSKNVARMGAISSAHSFNNLAGMWSGPEALFASSFRRNSLTPSELMLIGVMSGVGSPFILGRLVRSSWVHTEWKYLLKISAFSLLSWIVALLWFKGGIPVWSVGVLMRFVWRSLGVGLGVCLGGMGGWVSEWVLDKWHSLNANTHYQHEYSVLGSIWPKNGLSEFWKNTLQLLCVFIWTYTSSSFIFTDYPLYFFCLQFTAQTVIDNVAWDLTKDLKNGLGSEVRPSWRSRNIDSSS